METDTLTPDWHAARARTWRTASRAPAALGIGYCSPAELVREIVAGISGTEYVRPVSPAQQAAMDAGRRDEPMVRAAFEDRTGIILDVRQITREIDGIEYLASLDGLTDAAVIEIKRPAGGRASTRWRLAERGLMLPMDRVQITQQMMVSGRGAGSLVVAGDDPADQLEVWISLDTVLWDRIAAAWADITRHVEAGTLPKEPEAVRRDDQGWLMAAAAYAEAKRLADHHAERLEAAREALVALAGDDLDVVGGGVRVALHERRGAVDYRAKDIQAALARLDLDQYRKPTSIVERVSLFSDER